MCIRDRQSSASFGLLSFVSASGNAKSLHTQLPYSTNPSFGIISSSAQIASDISGSFTAGTGLDLSSGELSVASS